VGTIRRPGSWSASQIAGLENDVGINHDFAARQIGALSYAGALPKPAFFETLATNRETSGMSSAAFDTAISESANLLTGPWRSPKQMLHGLKVGMKTTRQTVTMDFDQNMGDLYPFSLREKLNAITEPSPYYSDNSNPRGRPIIPFKMLSVLFQYRAREDRLPIRGPAVGLFADQEIRLMRGPLFAGEDYVTEREVVALSGSRRTESAWVRTTVFAADQTPVAAMLLNLASIKDSYADCEREHKALYG
jgi:hypothetical protein